MEEKKPIKISLSTFFLILAVIVICIISYFAFTVYNEKIQLSEDLANLNSENQKLIEEVNTKITNTQIIAKNTNAASVNEETKSYSYKDIKGLYRFAKEIQNSDVRYDLYMYDNGTFEYMYCFDTEASIIGNYIIEDNVIILNKIFAGGNDVGLGTTTGQIKLKINSDGTITDTNNLVDEKIKARGLNIDLSNVTLTKASSTEEQEYVIYKPSINARINNSISENAIYKGESNN